MEETALHCGPWDDIPAAYLSSKILELCFSVIQNPNDGIITQLSLLAWVKPQEVKKYFEKYHQDIQRQIDSEMERERWKDHFLYKTKTKAELEKMCQSLKLPVVPSINKHELVNLICKNYDSMHPTVKPLQPLYTGNLSSIPPTAAGIQQLNMPKLKCILRYHNHAPTGRKDFLVLKVLLLRQGKTQAISAAEDAQLRDLINLTKKCIYLQILIQIIYLQSGASLSPQPPSQLPERCGKHPTRRGSLSLSPERAYL